MKNPMTTSRSLGREFLQFDCDAPRKNVPCREDNLLLNLALALAVYDAQEPAAPVQEWFLSR